jgi:hypothetical protein
MKEESKDRVKYNQWYIKNQIIYQMKF